MSLREEPCEGAGQPVPETPLWGTVICPVCRGIARTDGDKISELHTVRVAYDAE